MNRWVFNTPTLAYTHTLSFSLSLPLSGALSNSPTHTLFSHTCAYCHADDTIRLLWFNFEPLATRLYFNPKVFPQWPLFKLRGGKKIYTDFTLDFKKSRLLTKNRFCQSKGLLSHAEASEEILNISFSGLESRLLIS